MWKYKKKKEAENGEIFRVYEIRRIENNIVGAEEGLFRFMEPDIVGSYKWLITNVF